MATNLTTNDTLVDETAAVVPPADTASYQIAEDVVKHIVLPIICICGITGIILTVIVLSRKNMRTSTNCYLMALAVADLLYLVFLATILADNQFVPHSKAYYIYHIYITYATIFMHMFLFASIWITVMLAVERYIAICKPFLAAKMCTVIKARIFIVVIFAVAFVARMANFWETKVVTVFDPVTNSTLHYPDATGLSYNKHYQTIYPWVVDGIFASIVPFLLLLALNACLIWEVRKSTQYISRNLMVAQGGSNVVQREELQITIMLISVIIVFFICQAPYVIYTALASINQYRFISPAFMLFRYITMMLLTLKSAINFLLYCWFSEKFRATLKRIFCLESCLMLTNKNSQNGNYYNLRRLSSCATRESTF